MTENRDGVVDKIGNTEVVWKNKGKSMFYGLSSIIWNPLRRQVLLGMEQEVLKRNLKELDETLVGDLFVKIVPPRFKLFITNMMELITRKGK